MRCVRVWFSKTGLAKYISHLDLNRCMTRAVRRAEIPLWYTEGFNPHPYLNFSLPLSLGAEGMNESMDIRIEGDMENGEILEKLKNVMVDGIRVFDVTDPKNSPHDIAFAEYDITLQFAENADKFLQLSLETLSGEELIVEKPGKSGRKKVMKQVNLLPNIQSCSMERQGNDVKIHTVLPAGDKMNLNPTLLTEALFKSSGITAELTYITRERLLTEQMTPFK